MLGEIAYEAYRKQCGGKSLFYKDVDLPPWELLKEAIQEAWEAAAQAIREETWKGMTNPPVHIQIGVDPSTVTPYCADCGSMMVKLNQTFMCPNCGGRS